MAQNIHALPAEDRRIEMFCKPPLSAIGKPVVSSDRASTSISDGHHQRQATAGPGAGDGSHSLELSSPGRMTKRLSTTIDRPLTNISILSSVRARAKHSASAPLPTSTRLGASSEQVARDINPDTGFRVFDKPTSES